MRPQIMVSCDLKSPHPGFEPMTSHMEAKCLATRPKLGSFFIAALADTFISTVHACGPDSQNNVVTKYQCLVLVSKISIVECAEKYSC